MRRLERRPRELRDRTETLPVIDMKAVVRKTSSGHRNNGIALRLSNVGFAKKYVLDVVVIVIVAVIFGRRFG